MDWSAATTWWLVCGILVAAELATGTFYLLMVALGCAAGALGAHAGLGSTGQLVLAAMMGSGATAAWHVKRQRKPQALPAGMNHDVNLDIGQRVRVDHWDEDGAARVHYRGAQWTARYAGQGSAVPGEHHIVALDGNELRLAPVPGH